MGILYYRNTKIRPTEMSSSATIRVGLIGLSGKPRDQRTAGVSWAEIAHLQALQATGSYQIRALLNSSVESARDAIRLHGLSTADADIKAYGNPNGIVFFLM